MGIGKHKTAINKQLTPLGTADTDLRGYPDRTTCADQFG
jgi:hypothetical protein